MPRSPNKPLPQQELLHKLFDYDPQTGVVIRKSSAGNNCTRALIGKPVGTLLNSGYLQVKIKGTVYLLHRIIWMWFYNEDPGEFVIDHINHNKEDHRIDNLRKVTIKHNQWNLPVFSTSKTGAAGVRKIGKKFYADIYISEQERPGKIFDSFEEAVEWRTQMELIHRKIEST